MKFSSFTLEDIKGINKLDFVKRVYDKAINEEDLLSSSAQVAFYFAFALFPLLLFLVSIFGIVLGSGDDMRAELFYYLKQVMPGSALELVQKTLQEVTEGSSGGKLTFGALVALYSASAGIDSLRIGLNGVYNLTETRSWFKTKATSIFMTFVLAVLVFVALGIVFYGGKFVTLILDTISLPIPSPFILGILQVVVVLLVLLTIFALLYGYLPKHRESSWVWITPGAITGIVLWVAFSFAFKTYLSYFDSYNKTYGSLGAVIILLLWLYLTALVVLFGGTINAVLQEFTDPEAAEAGLNKAVAKEIVNNPDAVTIPDSLKTENAQKVAAMITTNNPNVPEGKLTVSENEELEKPAPEPEMIYVKPNMEEIKRLNKSIPLTLIVGSAFGLLAGLIYKNKNNKDDKQ